MAKTVTLSSIMSRIRSLADFGDSGWMDDTNLEAFVNLEFSAFRDLMVEVWPECLATSTTQAITSGTETYGLPAAFFYLVGVDYLDNDRYVMMKQAMFTQRSDYVNYDLYANSARNSRFMVVGTNLVLVPKPTWNGTIKIWYVPATTDLTSGAPNLDGVNGWEAMIIFGVLGHIEGKRGGDPSYWLKERMRAERRIRSMAALRHSADPATIRNTCEEDRLRRYPFGR